VSAPSLMVRARDAGTHNFSTHYARRPAPTGTLDAIDRLALRLGALCLSAVDHLAIVAGLEAEGYNDRAAREQYRVDDLFALAEELHRRVPRGMEALPPRPDSHRSEMLRALLRGFLFTAPALFGIGFIARRPDDVIRLAFAALQVLAWGYSQGVAHLAYARLGAGDRDDARRVLRLGTILALCGAAGLVGILLTATRENPTPILPVTIAIGYCLTAIPALVLGAELRLAATLGPAVLGAAAGAFGAPAPVVVGAMLCTLGGALLLALRLTDTPADHSADPVGPDLRGALPHVVAGLGTGALLTLVLADPGASSRGAPSGFTAAALHTAFVLTLGMGAAEWHASWYRHRVSSLLGEVVDPAVFARTAVRILFMALGRQAATVAVLALPAYLMFDTGNPAAPGLYLFALALGPGLMAALVLRGIDSGAALGPILAAALAAAMVAPTGDTNALGALATLTMLLLATRAADAVTQPWAHL
jgi:hypothetical protein